MRQQTHFTSNTNDGHPPRTVGIATVVTMLLLGAAAIGVQLATAAPASAQVTEEVQTDPVEVGLMPPEFACLNCDIQSNSRSRT